MQTQYIEVDGKTYHVILVPTLDHAVAMVVDDTIIVRSDCFSAARVRALVRDAKK